MFNNIKNYKKILDDYIDNININSENALYLIGELSSKDNILEYIKSVFEKSESGSILFFIDAVVYNNDDAYLNTIYSFLNSNFKRIYTVNEIIDITSKYSSLEYFCKFQEPVEINNIPETLINDIPADLKEKMFIYNGDDIKFINQNFCIYCFKKF